MGKRGPAPTPTKILENRGSWRAKARKGEPQPELGAPECPLWLGDDAKAIWEAVAKQLGPMGVLTKADENALARYCELWVRWKQAAAFLRERGEVYAIKEDVPDGKGGTTERMKCMQQWPQVSIVNKLGDQLHRLEQQFGMTPAARANIHVAKPDGQADEKDEKARFFRAHAG